MKPDTFLQRAIMPNYPERDWKHTHIWAYKQRVLWDYNNPPEAAVDNSEWIESLGMTGLPATAF